MSGILVKNHGPWGKTTSFSEVRENISYEIAWSYFDRWSYFTFSDISLIAWRKGEENKTNNDTVWRLAGSENFCWEVPISFKRELASWRRTGTRCFTLATRVLWRILKKMKKDRQSNWLSSWGSLKQHSSQQLKNV